MSLTNKLLPQDLVWLDNIIKWADDNNIEDYKLKQRYYKDANREPYWSGIPRDREKLYNLKELRISTSPKEVDLITPEIGRLKNLELLYISVGGRPSIPAEIGNLVNLKSLTLDVRAATLPDEICNLKNLEFFMLWADCKTLPENFGELKKLKVLDLESSGVIDFPRSIVKLTAIAKLVPYFKMPGVPSYQAKWIRGLMESGFYVHQGEELLRKSRLRLIRRMFHFLNE